MNLFQTGMAPSVIIEIRQCISAHSSPGCSQPSEPIRFMFRQPKYKMTWKSPKKDTQMLDALGIWRSETLTPNWENLAVLLEGKESGQDWKVGGTWREKHYRSEKQLN